MRKRLNCDFIAIRRGNWRKAFNNFEGYRRSVAVQIFDSLDLLLSAEE
jgi:hypothetical protein